MKNDIQRRETRSNTIFRHTREMLRDTGTSFESFAVEVVDGYHATTPEGQRSVDFRTGGDVFHDAKINAQKLRRWMDETINARLPSELEEAWVLALPGAHRERCVFDLCLRYSCLAVPLPKAGQDLSAFGDVLAKSAESFKASAPIMADGKIETGQTSDLIAAIREHQEAAGHHLAWAHALQQELEQRRARPEGKNGKVRAVK